jgi:hypothetical protein
MNAHPIPKTRPGRGRAVAATGAVALALAVSACSSSTSSPSHPASSSSGGGAALGGSSRAVTTAPGGSSQTSSGTGATVNPFSVDARKLLTLADATAVLGPGTTADSHCSANTCNYLTNGGIGVVSIGVAGAGTDKTQAMQGFTTSTTGDTPLPGIGDAAAYHILANGTGRIVILRYFVMIEIDVRNANASGAITPVTVDTLKQLAATANGRIS